MKIKKVMVIVCLLLFMSMNYFYDSYPDTVPCLTNDDIQKLRAGTIIITKQKQKTGDGQIARVTGAICIHKPINEVWKCLMDWESMPRYVDSLDYYNIVAKMSDDVLIIEGQLHVTFIKFRYTLIVNSNKSKYYQQWRLLQHSDITRYNLQNKTNPNSGGIKNIEGYQYCVPYDDTTTILYYAPVVAVSVPVPGFIEDSLTKKSIKDYLYGIKNYLEKVK